MKAHARFWTWLFFSSLVCVASRSAAAAAAAEESSRTNSGTIPFELRRNHVMVPARVALTNSLGSETNATTSPLALSLLLDTGYSMTMLHPDHVKTLGLRPSGRITIVGIAGEEPAQVFEGPRFEFPGQSYKPRRIGAFPATGGGGYRRRDGILGSGFFRRFVVEIDSTAKLLQLHEPSDFRYTGSGEILPLRFSGDTPVVDVSVRLPEGTEVKAAFEIDTGCDSELCLGQPFVTAHKLAPANAPDRGGKVGVGGGTRTATGHLAEMRLGQLVLANPTAELFLEGSPVDPPFAGHIGWELLKKYRVIFNYAQRQLILEKL